MNRVSAVRSQSLSVWATAFVENFHTQVRKTSVSKRGIWCIEWEQLNCHHRYHHRHYYISPVGKPMNSDILFRIFETNKSTPNKIDAAYTFKTEIVKTLNNIFWNVYAYLVLV
jgi:hypothetical protein